MSNVSIKGASSLDAVVKDIMDSAEVAITLAAKDASKKAADATKKRLRAVKHGKGSWRKYSGSWKAKAQDGGYIVYNEKHYRLTHLLEYGHDVIVNGRKVGRAKAYPHIADAAEQGVKDFEREVKEEIERRLGA